LSEVRGESEKRVVTTLTVSHVTRYLSAGSSIRYQSMKEDLDLSYTQIDLKVSARLGVGIALLIFVAYEGIRRNTLRKAPDQEDVK
jgi:hypothetical protein